MVGIINCSIFFKFWHNVSFVKDYSLLVSHHSIFQYFLAKGELCSFRRFDPRRSENDAKLISK